MSEIEDLIRSTFTKEQLLECNPEELGDRIAFGLDLKSANSLFERHMAEVERERYGRFDRLFPEDGEYRRALYPRHLEHFAAGRRYPERCFMAANRVGKTVAGAYELSCHATGLYPSWWQGRVFRRPIRAWAAGDTNETTRDVIQAELCGEVGWDGPRKVATGANGIIPRELLGPTSWKRGVDNLIDTIAVKHRSGGWSKIGFKSFDQGRRAFQGTAKEVIWLDEEVPAEVYDECLIRTATTRGMVVLTFTPLLGITTVVQSFMPKEDVLTM